MPNLPAATYLTSPLFLADIAITITITCVMSMLKLTPMPSLEDRRRRHMRSPALTSPKGRAWTLVAQGGDHLPRANAATTAGAARERKRSRGRPCYNVFASVLNLPAETCLITPLYLTDAAITITITSIIITLMPMPMSECRSNGLVTILGGPVPTAACPSRSAPAAGTSETTYSSGADGDLRDPMARMETITVV